MTKSLEIYADRVNIDAQLGSDNPLPVSLTAQATGDINVGTSSGATIRLGDGRHCRWWPMRRGRRRQSHHRPPAGGYVDIRVGTAASATPSSMELRGANVIFQGSQNVWLYGPARRPSPPSRTCVYPSADRYYLSVGSEGLTDVTAGGNV